MSNTNFNIYKASLDSINKELSRNIHGKAYGVDKESEVEFASGKKKYYHITDEKGNKHEIREDFIKKSEDLNLKLRESLDIIKGVK